MKRIISFFERVNEQFSERILEDVSPEVCAEGNYSCQNARGEFIPGSGPRLPEPQEEQRESREARTKASREVQLC